jgi:hypothetical protein
LSYYYAYGFEVYDTHQMGRRCYNGRFFNFQTDCREDVNAGAFHIALTNKIGLFKEGIIVDLDRFEQVWHYPIASYESRIVQDNLKPSSTADRHTIKEIRIETTIKYAAENGNSWEAVFNTPKQKWKLMTLVYHLEIDRFGLIVGGDWKSRHRPDFLWLKSKPKKFTGLLSRLGELLR